MNATQTEHEDAQKRCSHNNLTVWIVETRKRAYSRHAGHQEMSLDGEKCMEEDFSTAHITCDDCEEVIDYKEAMKLILGRD